MIRRNKKSRSTHDDDKTGENIIPQLIKRMSKGGSGIFELYIE